MCLFCWNYAAHSTHHLFSFLVSQTITDDDLIALVSDEVFQPQVVWKLGDVQVHVDFISCFNLVFLQSVGWMYKVVVLSIEKDLLPNAQVTCGSLGLSTATVRLIDADGEEHIACSVGTGPVDSAYKAVDLIVKV